MFNTDFIRNFIYSNYEERKRLVENGGLISSTFEIGDHPNLIRNHNFDLDFIRSELYKNPKFNEILDKNLIYDILKCIRDVYHNTFNNIVILFNNELVIKFTNDSKITEDTYVLNLNDESNVSLCTFHNSGTKHFNDLYDLNDLNNL